MVSREKVGGVKADSGKDSSGAVRMGLWLNLPMLRLRKASWKAGEGGRGSCGSGLRGLIFMGAQAQIWIMIFWDEYGEFRCKSGAAGGQSEKTQGARRENSEVKTSIAGKKVLSLNAERKRLKVRKKWQRRKEFF